jgi:hypothetical protein
MVSDIQISWKGGSKESAVERHLSEFLLVFHQSIIVLHLLQGLGLHDLTSSRWWNRPDPQWWVLNLWPLLVHWADSEPLQSALSIFSGIPSSWSAFFQLYP